LKNKQFVEASAKNFIFSEHIAFLHHEFFDKIEDKLSLRRKIETSKKLERILKDIEHKKTLFLVIFVPKDPEMRRSRIVF
jgi:hypothetical protein